METIITFILLITGLLLFITLRRLVCGAAAPLFTNEPHSIDIRDPLAEHEKEPRERKGFRSTLLNICLALFITFVGCLAYLLDSLQHKLMLVFILVGGIAIYAMARRNGREG